MDHRVPKVGATIGALLALFALLTFIYLNEKFEGPSVATPVLGEGYRLTAVFADSEALPTKQPVLYKGVSVGRVTDVSYDGERQRAVVEFAVDDELGPVYANSSVSIGERSLLGDPFLNLDRGTPDAGELESGARVRSRKSVDFDEAFDFLDRTGREHLRSIIDTLGEGTRTPGAGEKLNATLGGLARITEELEQLTAALDGQEDRIAALVADSATVLGELGSREQAVRSIVGSGRSTLDAVAASTESLDRAIVELPRLLGSGREALATARPLITEARPLVNELADVAPDLRPALRALGPFSADVSAIIAGLEPQRKAATPILPKATEVTRLSLPVVEKLEPTTRNLVPIVEYLAPRANSVAAFFSHASSAFSHGDEEGKWARFAFHLEPGELTDVPTAATCYPEDDLAANSGFCQNAYPDPNDALDNEPFEPGTYPRLMPYDPPPPPAQPEP